MLDEERNLARPLGRARQPELGRTLVAQARIRSADELLERVRETWIRVASWGRWCDENRVMPARDECVALLPPALVERLNATGDLENWLGLLDDRHWIWSAACVVNDCVLIDVQCDCEPSSTWTLEVVLESLGGRILYRDLWLSDHAVERLVDRAAGRTQ